MKIKKILRDLLLIAIAATLCLSGAALFASDLDDRIESSVKNSYVFTRYLKDENIHIQSKDGAVTLRGKASSTAQKDLTTEYAMDVEGVKNVINEITVEPVEIKPDKVKTAKKADTVIESMDDASITAIVKTTLLYHRSTSALNTTVTTNEGVVKLSGNVKNAAEKELATKLVSDVHGVKGVVNTMTIN